jgi:hypothetical protein
MSPLGRAVVTWAGDDLDGVPWCGFSNSYDGAFWGTPQQFVFNDVMYSKVAVNNNGDALLVFYYDILKSARLPFGGVWTEPEVICKEGHFFYRLAPFLSNDGFAMIGWGSGFQSLHYYSNSDR